MKDVAKTREFKIFVKDVKARIREAQYAALKVVNRELIQLYWDIGKMIVLKQDELGWGKAVVENLANDLQKEFPDVRGFSSQNLWYMRKFYTEYSNSKKLQPLVGEISWSKNIIVFSKCKNEIEREFYMQSTKKFGWSKDVLIHQIDNKTFKKPGK